MVRFLECTSKKQSIFDTTKLFWKILVPSVLEFVYLDPFLYLQFVVMSTNCWWENLYFSFKGLKKRRQMKSVATLNGTAFPVWYYSPVQLQTLFKPYFEKQYQKPVSLFIPPSYLNNFFLRKRFFLKILSLLEKLFGSFGFLANTADHYLMVFKKRVIWK